MLLHFQDTRFEALAALQALQASVTHHAIRRMSQRRPESNSTIIFVFSERMLDRS
jgi:type II secretory pathway component PulJ